MESEDAQSTASSSSTAIIEYKKQLSIKKPSSRRTNSPQTSTFGTPLRAFRWRNGSRSTKSNASLPEPDHRSTSISTNQRPPLQGGVPTGGGQLFRNAETANRLSQSLTELDKHRCHSKFYIGDDENVKRVLDAVKADQDVPMDESQRRKRRTLVLSRDNGHKFGFTVQTYLLLNPSSNQMEQISYVDYVELGSPANFAGLRAGDIIVSINGRSVRHEPHQALVRYIGSCHQMRVIVLFENCVEKVELCRRALKLKKLLRAKEHELRELDAREQSVLLRGSRVGDDVSSSLGSTSLALSTTGSCSTMWSGNSARQPTHPRSASCIAGGTVMPNGVCNNHDEYEETAIGTTSAVVIDFDGDNKDEPDTPINENGTAEWRETSMDGPPFDEEQPDVSCVVDPDGSDEGLVITRIRLHGNGKPPANPDGGDSDACGACEAAG